MTEDTYKTPEARLESPKQGTFREVKRPWFIYLMAIWSFLGISGFLNTVVRVFTRNNPEMLQISSLGVLLIAIILIVYILQMRRNFIIAFGILCVMLALWQSFNFVGVLLSERPNNPIIYFLLFYIIPSIILAVLALRPSLWILADDYRKFQHFKSMQKASLKAMRK